MALPLARVKESVQLSILYAAVSASSLSSSCFMKPIVISFTSLIRGYSPNHPHVALVFAAHLLLPFQTYCLFSSIGNAKSITFNVEQTRIFPPALIFYQNFCGIFMYCFSIR
jgi:hypothetical protein